MAIPKFTDDIEIITKLGVVPGSDDGLSTQEFKEKFDEAARRFKNYINNVLTVGIDKVLSSGGVFSVNGKLPNDDGAVSIKAEDIAYETTTVKLKLAEVDAKAGATIPTTKIGDGAVTTEKIAANANSDVIPVTIPVTGWSDTTLGMKATVSAPGLLSTYKALIDANFSRATQSADGYEALEEAFGLITTATIGNDSVSFYASDKPDIAIPVDILILKR